MLLRVNLQTKEARSDKLEVTEEFPLMGGRALTSKIISSEVPPECDPFSAQNKLVFAGGILSGAGVSSAGRLSVGAKSPLTGGIKESNAGGITANKLAHLGYKGIVVEEVIDKDDTSLVLVITQKTVKFEDASWLKGLGNYKTAGKLLEKYPRAGIISIGPAGERGLLSACISNSDSDGNQTRVNGRGGLGAVMGKKGLKAIVIDDSEASETNMTFYDYETFKELRKEFAKEIAASSSTEAYKKYGTPAMVDVTNNLGALPTNNFSKGSFEKAEKISGQYMRELIENRGGDGRSSHSCMQTCVVLCSNVFPDSEGKEIVAPLEYETIGLLGSNLAIGDLDEIARLNRYCNDLGIDTIEMGAALGVVMEEGLVDFGDYEGVMKLLEEIEKDTVKGRLIASGAKIVGKVLGARRTPHVKGQGLPAYDPRGVKGLGVTYATNPMGADHTAGMTIRAKVDHSSKEGQVELSKNSQVFAAGIDSFGLCLFIGSTVGKRRDLVSRMISVAYGIEVSDKYILKLGEEVLRLEREFNQKAGITSTEDKLPEFFAEEYNPDCDARFDITRQEMQEGVWGH